MDGKKEKWIRWFNRLYPIVVVAALYCVCITRCHMQYLSNDDTSIHSVLSGEYSGAPYPVHQFIHFLLGYGISGLYRLFPDVLWWFYYSHALTACGALLINVSLMRLAERHRVSAAVPAILVFLIDFILLLHPVANIGYTIVPAVLGSGVAAFLMTGEETKRGKWFYLACFLLFLPVVFHRSNVARVIACYLVLAACCLAFGREGKTAKKILFAALAIVCLGCTLFAAEKTNTAVQNEVQGEDFTAFNKARARYIDYPRESYEDNPELYEQAGWTKDVWQMVEHWSFMDERVTAESLSYLAEQGETRTMNFATLKERWVNAREDPLVDSAVNFWLLMLLAALAALVIQHKPVNLLAFALNVLGTVLLILYQAYLGRVLYRTVIICLLPSAVINAVLFVKAAGQFRKQWVPALLAVMLLASAVLTTGSGRRFTLSESIREDNLGQEQLQQAVGDYAVAHPGNVYVINVFLTRNESATVHYPKEKPANLFPWGDSTFLSGSDQEKLKNNGLTALTAEVMKRDNVFLITNVDLTGISESGVSEGNSLVDFYLWLKHDYGACGFRQVDTVCEGIGVYRFCFDKSETEEPMYDYQNGAFIRIGNES